MSGHYQRKLGPIKKNLQKRLHLVANDSYESIIGLEADPLVISKLRQSLEASYEALLRYEKQIKEIQSSWLNYLQGLDSEIQGQEDDLMASVFAGEEGLMELSTRSSDERARIQEDLKRLGELVRKSVKQEH